MTTWLPFSLLGLIIGLATGRFIYLRMKQKRIERRRVVERPNSFYDAAGVKDQRDHDRWRNMDLNRLHEVNREYVVQLLERVRALGVDHLKPDERDFLDRMNEMLSRGRQGRQGA